MNILQIISGGETGGSKNHLLSLSEYITKKDYKNIIVCFMDGALYQEALKSGIDIRLIKQKNRLDLNIVDEIRNICARECIDIINCHGGRANLIGYLLMKKYKAHYFTTIHSDYLDDYRGNWYKSAVYSNINRYVLKKFQHYITVSESFKTMMIERGFSKDKISVVYNGIKFQDIPPELSRDEIINKYKLPLSNHYVSIVARLHPVKGHKTFLNAAKSILNKFKDVVFVIVGDGELEEELKKYVYDLGITESVVFTGFINPSEIIYISDFTTLTSYTESFPLVILESARQKRTVIATNVGGIADLIDDNFNGYLINPGDSDDLAEKMYKLLDDNEKSRVFGLKLYEKAKNNYAIENMGQSYLEIYDKAMKNC